MKNQTFGELLERYESAMDALALEYSTRLESLIFAGKVVKYHESKNRKIHHFLQPFSLSRKTWWFGSAGV